MNKKKRKGNRSQNVKVTRNVTSNTYMVVKSNPRID